MNYFYIDNDEYVLGYTTLKVVDEIKKIVPRGYKFYFYKTGDNLTLIAETNQPAGIGTGLKIDY